MLRSILAALALALATACATSPPPAPRVHVAEGWLAGAEQHGVRRFLGIPYAAPPIGNRRWAAPAPAAPWNGDRDATAFGASCMQRPAQPFGPFTHEYVSQPPPSEDCLFLNVWTPAASANERLPILVWIHGGAFLGGSGAVPIYDGANLARTGIIVVTINYRVGVFGFFSNAELTAEGVRGAQGALDAIAALRWLHANAAAFGGDAERITIAGQSAGGALVNMLMLAPQARGLFAGAITESMPLDGVPTRTYEETVQRANALAAHLGANSLRELRTRDAASLLEAQQAVNPGPLPIAIDGAVLTADPFALAQRGGLADVPWIAGFTAEESRFTGTLADYRTTMASRYGAHAQAFLATYPAKTDAAARDAARQSAQDRLVSTLQRFPARTAPVYLYMYAHAPPPPSAADTFGAHHSSEIPYVFGTLDAAPERGFTAADRAISARMMSYWSAFVRAGDPNAPGLPTWPRAEGDAGAVMELGETWATLPPLAPTRRAFFDAYFNDGGRGFLF